jgi:hypothetical protein
MAFDRRSPEHQCAVPNGRRVTDPRVPRGIFPFLIGSSVEPPIEWPRMRLLRPRPPADTSEPDTT